LCSLIQIKIEQGQKASFRLLFFENELDQTRHLWITIFNIFEVFFEEIILSAEVELIGLY